MTGRFTKALLFSFGLLCSAFGTMRGQNDDIQFEHLSMKDGLSMNPVMAIAQDKKGFLWFGTQDGLNRYDGYKFTIFKTNDDDSTSISDNFITAQCVDASGNLWVGTLSGGINKYISSAARFQRFSRSSTRNALGSDRIWTICEGDKGELWVGTDAGITIVDPASDKFTKAASRYPALRWLDNSSVLCIFRDNKGIYWFGTTSGLARFHPAKNDYTFFSHEDSDPASLSNDIVLTIFQDSKDNIWVGTVDGLNKLDPATKKFTIYTFKDEDEKLTQEMKSSRQSTIRNIYSIVNNYGGNTIRCILEDGNGMLWIGTDMELVIFNPLNGKFINYKKDLINPTGINDHFIRSMYKDRSGNLWIGTLGNGLNKVNLKPKKFQHYHKKINNPYSLSENYVRALCEDGQGNLWVGVLVGGLNRFDKSTGSFYRYKRSPGGINDDNVWSLCFDEKRNCLWIGTNNGLNRLDLATQKFTAYVHDRSDPYSISENTVRSIFIDSRDNLWVGTEGGLNRLDAKTEQFIHYMRGDGNSISDNTVWHIREDRKGNIWLATNDGLNKYDPAANTFTVFRKEPGNSKSISHNGIRTLHIDSKGVLWIGTQNGLNKFDEASRSFTRYNETHGLPNPFIYAIQEDKAGHLWISTNKGICEFDPVSIKCRNYDISDGLQDYEFNTNAAFTNHAGEMYFGGPSGFNRFNPDKMQANDYPAPVEITGIRIQDKPYVSDVDISEVKEIAIEYDQDILYFDFSALDYTNPSRNQYAYMMEGFNEDWIYCGNTRFITYTNLDPGEYVFKVKGSNSDGVWNETPDAVRVIVRPPFYRTNWFYALCGLTLFGGFYSYYRLRTRHLQNTKSMLEKQVRQRTFEVVKQKNEIEQQNRELERLSIVASETGNVVLILDAEGRLEWVNSSFEKLNGITLHDLKALKGETIFEISNNPEIRSIVDQCVSTRSPFTYESLNVTQDGRRIWESSTMTPIFDDKGKLKKLVIIDTDVTDRKNAEEIIRQKNKDITDSINYAKRIQQAILPPEESMRQVFRDSFVLFKPKDVVSGDFYWFTTMNDHFLVAAVDCTGHGVPGAFMSMIGNDLLNQIVNESHVTTPAMVLDELNGKLVGSLNQRGGNIQVNDGMDIAFCAINHKERTLQYSGAHRPMLLVRDGKMTEYKANKFSIGGYKVDNKKFNDISLQLQKDDCIYIFSDGYADQFGGAKGKKFKYKNFQQLLLEIHALPMSEQKQALDKTIEAWRGSLEQIDDILVIGMRFEG